MNTTQKRKDVKMAPSAGDGDKKPNAPKQASTLNRQPYISPVFEELTLSATQGGSSAPNETDSGFLHS